MMRVLLIDDEEPARDRLGRLIGELEGLEIVGEAADADQGRQKIAELAPDLVFLDIEMPGSTGLELAATLAPPRPHIVFCTAYDQYALRAFELNAIDYLLKPVKRQRLAATIERVRSELLEQREAKVAFATQQRQFAAALPPLDHLELDGLCRPAREVGGDGYDFLELGDGRVGLLIADVAGKGLGAALLMAGLLGRVQALAPRWRDDLPAMFAELNDQVGSTSESGRYATMFYAVWHDHERSLRWVNAGHVPPILLRADGHVERLEPSGTVVGLLDGATWRAGESRLYPGDRLVAVTDGVTERTNRADEELGEARWLELVRGGSPLSELLEALEGFADGEPAHDDTTIITARAR